MTESKPGEAVTILIRSLVLLGLLFAPAGTLLWPQAWIAVGLFVIFCLCLWRRLRTRDPELLRRRISSESELVRVPSDRYFALAYKFCFLIWIVGMGLDVKRFQWSSLSVGVNVIGGCLLLLALLLHYFVFKHNTFLTREISVQSDRDHEVIDTGPYGMVRHPMYLANGLMFVGAAMLMGSWLGIGLAIVMILLLAVRTRFEERILEESLVGYAEYRERVRHRMIPRVW